MAITLNVTEGPHQGKVFTFSEHDTFLVGRSPEAHFQLPDKDGFISRTHFLIEVNPPLCRLVDMGSQNGTYVNGQRVQSVDLKNGDRIALGQTVIQAVIPPDGTISPEPATVDYVPDLTGAARNEKNEKPTKKLTAGYLVIPGYRIKRELGRGSMGVVYLAKRESDNSEVALKTIIPAMAGNRIKLERFLREAKILQKLKHSHIVAFHDAGVAGGRLFFAMDYIRGPSAAFLLDENGPLPVKLAVRLLCQLLDALEYAHEKGIVHRDIKPENILVPRYEGKRTVKLTDFGLARTYRASQLSGLTMHGSIGGTIPFMPPEQILSFRKVQPPSDQYSAAASLYNLLTGHYIFDFPADTAATLSMILEDEPVPIRKRRSEIPKGLAQVIHRALAKRPEQRFSSVTKMRNALLPFVK